MKRISCDLWIQVFMYSFMYIDNDTISEEEYFSCTDFFSKITGKGQLQDQSQIIDLDLVTFVENIMIVILTLIKQK